ncbi:ribonuclease III [Roseobacter sp. HKCCA0434]|uniref:ribonuclease III n=1 Tax=Roseobacter sp. HKCCA0434 TaxID=3079297 RepID=UPI003967A002
MSGKAARAALMRALGHEFAKPELLERALTHSSIASKSRPDNQRLEFLGDRVLGLVIAEALLDEDKDAAEGTIAPRFNALVRKETCAEIATAIGIGEALILGRSEAQTGGRRKTALLGDAMEAVIAALYRDAGMDRTREIILTLWADRIEGAAEDARDAKTRLQELAQARGQALPDYRVVDRRGPDHKPVFTVEVRLEDGASASAEASSKRDAEQRAAKKLLSEVGDD